MQNVKWRQRRPARLNLTAGHNLMTITVTTRMKSTLYYAPMTGALVPYVTLTAAGADFDVHIGRQKQQF